MTDHEMLPDEPLIEGLTGLSHEDFLSPVPPDLLREKVWHQTARAVRARPRRRRVHLAGWLVVAYLAGLGTFQVLGERGTLPLVEIPAPGEATGEEKRPAAEVLPADPRGLEDKLRVVAAAEQQQLLRTAGDRYLSERLDVASALHCYRKLLNSEAPSSRELLLERESWLLSALRHARELEVTHEEADG